MESTMVLYCVNPFDVNPIGGVVKVEEASAKSPPAPKQAGKNAKLEMEEFADLAPYLPTAPGKTMMMSSSIDELNTPIFERKGPFDFPVSDEQTYSEPPASASSSDQLKFEYESLSPEAAPSPPDAFINYTNVSNLNNSEDAIMIDHNGGIMVVSAEALFSQDQGAVYTFTNNKHNSANETPITTYNNNLNHNDNIATYKIEDCNVTASDSSLPTTYDQHLGLVTPEDSNSSEIMTNRPGLSLNLSNIFSQPAPMNTPDVIDSVVNMEDSFNILDYVNAKDVTTVNIEDIRFDLPTTSSQQEDFPDSPPPTSQRGRKRKLARRYEDDDEDYVPPSEKPTSYASAAADDSDAESDISVAASSSKSKKSRPSRRTSSISSDHSDAYKYRELRDKNNEASRKSRLKRKVKEQTLEKEADVLREKNIKLRARVEELEKVVENFRSNLFKIMLKK